jgi:hypothetical protein
MHSAEATNTNLIVLCLIHSVLPIYCNRGMFLVDEKVKLRHDRHNLHIGMLALEFLSLLLPFSLL